MQWTLCEHDGLPGMVAVVAVSKAEARKVRRAGGVLFDSYEVAAANEYAANYPDPTYEGLYGKPLGKWSRCRIEGQRIFVPSQEKAA